MENIVKLDADHSSVCKFGGSQRDRDNFELVRVNIRDLYKNALSIGEFSVISSVIDRRQDPEQGSDELEARLGR